MRSEPFPFEWLIKLSIASRAISKVFVLSRWGTNNLSDSKIITPKKRYIFNRIHPFKLLGAFKKELTNFTNYSHQNSKLN